VATSSRASERASVRPMATSNDVVFTTRRSASDLTAAGGSRSGLTDRTAPSTDSGLKDAARDSNENVAACYGIDTVHSWATVSASTALSAWRSDHDLHRATQTVNLDTSPVDKRQHQQSVLAAGVSVPDVRLMAQNNSPIPPPRTKRKARASLHASLNITPGKL